MTTPRISLTLRRGDTWTIPVTVVNDAGERIDLTGRTYLAQVRATPNASTPLATFTIDTTDAGTGALVLDLAASVTQGLPSGTLWTDLQESDGDAAATLFEVQITVEKDITRE